MCIWTCECRNSDQIMIVIGSEENKDINSMFDDKSYNHAKYFECNDYDSAIDYVYKQIKYMFKDKINKGKHFKFDLYKSIKDLQRIKDDASMLDYDDYYELASFYDEDEMYSCDLIIFDGKMGLQYNFHDNDECENLTFKEEEINLESETSLMLDMQKKLNKFIEEELEYSIEMDTNIKI